MRTLARVLVNMCAMVGEERDYVRVLLPEPVSQANQALEHRNMIAHRQERQGAFRGFGMQHVVVGLLVDEHEIEILTGHNLHCFGQHFQVPRLRVIGDGAVAEYQVYAGTGEGDDCHLFTCPHQRIKQGVTGEHRAFIEPDAVGGWHGAGEHAGETDRGFGWEYGAGWVLQCGGFLHGEEVIGIFAYQTGAQGIRCVEQAFGSLFPQPSRKLVHQLCWGWDLCAVG